MKRKLILCLVASLLLVAVFGNVALAQVRLDYWTGGGDWLTKLETPLIEKWNKLNPGIQVKPAAKPAIPTSEEALLIAIATRTAPDIASDLEFFFANKILPALVPLDELPGFWDLVKSKNMGEIIEYIKAPDGHIYVLPQWWTPALWNYNVDLLDKAGFTEPPKTFSEFLKFAEAIKPTPAINLEPFPAWWKLGYTLHVLFTAATEGDSTVIEKDWTNNLDTNIGKMITNFLNTLWREEYAIPEIKAYKFEKGEIGVNHIEGAGGFEQKKRKYPSLNMVVAPAPVPDEVYPKLKTMWTEASAKGWSIFRTSSSIEDAWEFLKWRFGSVEHDARQLEIIGHFPARVDLLTNPAFREYFATHPVAKMYAEFVPYATTFTNPYKIIIFDKLKKVYWEPLAYGKKTPEEAIEDAVKTIEELHAKV